MIARQTERFSGQVPSNQLPDFDHLPQIEDINVRSINRDVSRYAYNSAANGVKPDQNVFNQPYGQVGPMASGAHLAARPGGILGASSVAGRAMDYKKPIHYRQFYPYQQHGQDNTEQSFLVLSSAN